MVDMEFKVGDRVRCIKRYSIVPVECCGTVKENDNHGHTIGVEWDDNIGGHDGGGFFKGKVGYCYYISYQYLTKITEQKHPTIIIRTDGTTTTATLRQGKNVTRTAEAKCNPDDTFDYAVGARLALDRLMPVAKAVEVKPVEVKQAEKAEPIKLYCIEDRKSGWTPLTKGKVYSFEYGGIMYDNGSATSDRDKTLGGWIKRNPNIIKHLVPLVSRPAKVGEWIYVDNINHPDRHGTKLLDGYSVGDTLFIDGNEERADKDGFIWGVGLMPFEYLVLDGYAPKPEVKEVKRAAKVGEWIRVIDIGGHNKEKGIYKVAALSEYVSSWVFVDKQNCIRDDQYLVLENYAPETE